MNRSHLFGLFGLFLVFFLVAPLARPEAAPHKKASPGLPSITGKVILVEKQYLSSVIQVSRAGHKGGLHSVRALVNNKTELRFNGEKIMFQEITQGSTVRLVYERVKKGIIMARKIYVIKLKMGPGIPESVTSSENPNAKK